MKRLAFLALPMCLIFLLVLGVEDGFSRGGGGRGGGGMRGGGFGGGYGGGGAAYRGGAASRSPSMSSYSRQRSSVSQSRPKQSRPVASQPKRPSTSSKVASKQQRPSTPGKVPSQRPASSGQKLASTAGSKAGSKVPGTGGPRPSQGQLQQFLNLPQQGGKGLSDLGKVGVGAAAGALGYAGAKQLLESQRPGGERPGLGDRGGVGERPGAGDRLHASTLPAERPGMGGRPGAGERPGRGERPSQLPSRPNADQIRHNVQNRYDNLFTPRWWKDHPNMAKAYWQNFGKYQYARNHWWRHATWAALGGWVVGASWGSPDYYDYGEGIYYEDEQVYMNGQPVASAQEYYQQASDLATSAPPVQPAETEWLPLGVFAISRDQATDSNALLQLAVDKNGVIAGTYNNTSTDVARPIKGQVDKKTQRAAWTFADGKNTDIIMETGIVNLTKDQTEALVHFGKDKTEQWLMVRLDQPKSTETAKEEGK
jgi:hypothetical protein